VPLGETLTVAEGVGDEEIVPLELAEDDPVPVGEPEGEGEPDEDKETKAEADWVAEGFPVAVAERDPLGEGFALTELNAEKLTEDDAEPERVGEPLGEPELVADGEELPEAEDVPVMVRTSDALLCGHRNHYGGGCGG